MTRSKLLPLLVAGALAACGSDPEPADTTPDGGAPVTNLVNHSFEQETLAPGATSETFDDEYDHERADPTRLGSGTGFLKDEFAAVTVRVVHPDATMVEQHSPLAAPAHGNNAAHFKATGNAEAFLWTDSIEEPANDGDVYTFTVAAARPKGATASTRQQLTMQVGTDTVARVAIPAGTEGVFADQSISVTVPPELHGLKPRFGVRFTGQADAGLLVDNYRVTVARSGKPAPTVAPGLLNASFEEPALASGDYLADALHWTRGGLSGGYFGIARHTTAQYDAAADGAQVLEVNADVSVRSRAVLNMEVGKSYLATVAVAKRKDLAAPVAGIGLYTDGEILVTLGGRIPTTEWADISACYTATEAVAGKPLHIELGAMQDPNASGLQRALFDNVRITVLDEGCRL